MRTGEVTIESQNNSPIDTNLTNTKCHDVIEKYNAIVDIIYIFLVVCFLYAALLTVTYFTSINLMYALLWLLFSHGA